jgi:hypothetical protein
MLPVVMPTVVVVGVFIGRRENWAWVILNKLIKKTTAKKVHFK